MANRVSNYGGVSCLSGLLCNVLLCTFISLLILFSCLLIFKRFYSRLLSEKYIINSVVYTFNRLKTGILNPDDQSFRCSIPFPIKQITKIRYIWISHKLHIYVHCNLRYVACVLVAVWKIAVALATGENLNFILFLIFYFLLCI